MKSGKRKLVTLIVMVLSLAVCGWITVTAEANEETVRMNGIVLGIMILLILIAYFGGICKVDKIIGGLNDAIQYIDENSGNIFPRSVLADLKFSEDYLDGKYAEFLEYQRKFADAEIADFMNEDDISVSTHRGVWETFSDFLTSIGILGTFIGLIVGLKGFDLTSLEQFSSSVVPLLEGIKVAFITSIYGISLSLSYSYGLLSTYGDMEAVMDIFIDKFHVFWGKEQGLDEKMLNAQKEQTDILRELTETFQQELAVSFADVITPTILKLNEQFEIYSEGQQQMLKDTATQFAEEFRNAFVGGFTQFEQNLEKTNEMQTQYMKFLDYTMKNLSDAVQSQQSSIGNFILQSANQQDANMKDVTALIKKMNSAVTAFTKVSNQYYDSIASITERLNNNEYVLTQGLRSFMEQLEKFVKEMNTPKKDYSQDIKELQNVSMNGVQHICQLLEQEKVLLQEERTLLQNGEHVLSDNQQVLKDIQLSMKEYQEKQPDFSNVFSASGDQTETAGQNELMYQLLLQMKEMVELQKRRENRGLRRLFSRRKR